MLPFPPSRLFALGASLPVLLVLGRSSVRAPEPTSADVPFGVEDRFGRAIDARGVDLLDWEGPLANPRVTLLVRPGDEIPADRYPLRVDVRGSTPRLMLERFSRLNEEASTKIVHLEKPGDVAQFDLALFPDADGEDETHALSIRVEDAAERPWSRELQVRVEDRDVPRPPGLAIALDFSHDETGFFQDERVRATVARAAAELGELLDDQGFAPVPAEAEVSWIWNAAGFDGGREVTNTEEYTGFRVIAHGIEHDAKHSGSCASNRRDEALQKRGEEATGLRRSGTIALEKSGNWNARGWYVDEGDPLGWMRSRNLEADQHDLLSIARHELLHTLVYHRAHPAYAQRLQEGRFVDADLRAYLGGDPAVDDSEHLCDTVDPVSGFGAFGNEYGSVFPWRRWLPTKVDLLVLRAVGYRVRPHSALTPLALAGGVAASPEEVAALAGTAGMPLASSVSPVGGVAPYCLSLIEGALPPGVALDGWTGALNGTATEAGTFTFKLRLDDQDRSSAPVERSFALTIAAAQSPEPVPIDAGATPGDDAGDGDGGQGDDEAPPPAPPPADGGSSGGDAGAGNAGSGGDGPEAGAVAPSTIGARR